MKYELSCTLVLSRDIDENLVREIFLSEDVREFLKKGAPPGAKGTEIVSYEKSGEKIRLTLVSDRYVRATSALLRLRKYLEQHYGKKLKAGIKDVHIDKLIVSHIPLEKEPIHPITIHFFVQDIKVEGLLATVVFKDITMDLLEKSVDSKVISLVQEKAVLQHYAGKEESKKLVYASPLKEVLSTQDPAVELEQRGWIRRTAAKGQFVYGPNFTELVRVFQSLLKEYVYEPLGFREMIFPKFEPWYVPRTSGHCKNIYPVAYFVMVPTKGDPVFWEREMDYYKLTGDVYTKGIMEKVEPVGIMSYAQCPPFWQYLQHRVIAMESLPIKVYDWSGPTYRNESGGTHGIERIEEFHRAETLFVGTSTQVEEIVEQLQQKFTYLFEKILDLEIRVYEVAPWWLVQEGSVKVDEKFLGAKTFDFEAYLPYRGERETAPWLEIQNVSNNGKKYPMSFGVKAQRGELWSGCAGGSFERWACAFLAQKGLDDTAWPPLVKERFRKAPSIVFV